MSKVRTNSTYSNESDVSERSGVGSIDSHEDVIIENEPEQVNETQQNVEVVSLSDTDSDCSVIFLNEVKVVQHEGPPISYFGKPVVHRPNQTRKQSVEVETSLFSKESEKKAARVARNGEISNIAKLACQNTFIAPTCKALDTYTTFYNQIVNLELLNTGSSSQKARFSVFLSLLCLEVSNIFNHNDILHSTVVDTTNVNLRRFRQRLNRTEVRFKAFVKLTSQICPETQIERHFNLEELSNMFLDLSQRLAHDANSFYSTKKLTCFDIVAERDESFKFASTADMNCKIDLIRYSLGQCLSYIKAKQSDAQIKHQLDFLYPLVLSNVQLFDEDLVSNSKFQIIKYLEKQKNKLFLSAQHVLVEIENS